jgi:hypothetical protein
MATQGFADVLCLTGVWLGGIKASGPPPPDVPKQIPGGKGPLLRPQFDHLATLRTGPTGDALRTVRELQRSIEQTSRQHKEPVLA